jgi:hypothetical protein
MTLDEQLSVLSNRHRRRLFFCLVELIRSDPNATRILADPTPWLEPRIVDLRRFVVWLSDSWQLVSRAVKTFLKVFHVCLKRLPLFVRQLAASAIERAVRVDSSHVPSTFLVFRARSSMHAVCVEPSSCARPITSSN